MIQARGQDGTVKFNEVRVVISRQGLLARLRHGGAGETSIPLDQVVGVEVKRPGLSVGRLTILTAGSTQRPGGWEAHRNDPMSVSFRGGRQWREALAVKDALELALTRRQMGSGSGTRVD